MKNWNLAKVYHNKTDQWATPKDIYISIIEQGYKDFNPLEENYKNSLLLPNDNYYCNPPFSDIEPFVDYMINNTKKGFSSIMLLPIRLNTNWFIKLLLNGCKIIVLGRIKYGDAKSAAPFDSMLVELDPNIKENTISFIRKLNKQSKIDNIQLSIQDI